MPMIDETRLTPNEFTPVADIDLKKPSDFSAWIGFNKPPQSVSGKVLLDKGTVKDIQSKDKSIEGGIYDFSKYILENKNVTCSVTDDGLYVVEKMVQSPNGAKTVIGILDKDNHKFLSAQAKIKGGKVSYEPIDDLDTFKSVFFSSLLAERLDSNMSLKRKFSDFGKLYNEEREEIISSNFEKNKIDFVKNLTLLSKSVYDNYFSYSTDKTTKEQTYKAYGFESINGVISEDMINSLPEAKHIYGELENSFFQKVERKASNLRPTSTKEAMEAFNMGIKERDSKDYIHREELLESRGKIVTGWMLDILHLCTDLISSKRKAYENNPLSPTATPVFKLVGPSGSGKSYNIETMSVILGLPFRTIQCHANTSSYDFDYKSSLINGKSVLTPSAAIQTWRDGGLLNLDEFYHMLNKEAAVSLTTVIKSGYYIEMEEKYIEEKLNSGKFHPTVENYVRKEYEAIKEKMNAGEIHAFPGIQIPVHPDAIIFQTGNLGYTGTKDTSDRFADSVTMSFNVPPYNKDEMFAITRNSLDEILNLSDSSNILSANMLNSIDKADFEEVLYALCSVIEVYNTTLLEASKGADARKKTKQPYIDIRHLPGTLNSAIIDMCVENLFGNNLDWRQAIYNKITAPGEQNSLFASDLVRESPQAVTNFVAYISNAPVSSGKTLSELLLSRQDTQDLESLF